MLRVLITDQLSAAGLRLLEENSELQADVRSGLAPAEIREALKEADAILIRSGTKLTADILAGQNRLKAIVRAGVGVDNIDLAAATREGIVVMNTPAGNTTSTAEHTIAMLLALSRNIAAAASSMRAGKWERKKFTGTQLAGKTLAIIGLGRIGQSVAQRAAGLEMKVIGYDPFLSAERAAEQGIELYRDVDDLVRCCDYLTVHTPLNDETRGMIDAERIAKMKKGVRIINCARGGIVDENALAEAIESGHVAGAALDVFVHEPPENSPLINLPNVLTTPHLGASTSEAQELVAIEAAEIITGFLLRNEIRHSVNMAPISAAEMADLKNYLDLSYRLGLLLAQQNKACGLRSATIHFRGEAASRNTRLLTAGFAAGLLESAFDDSVNIVNAQLVAHERGIEIAESCSPETGAFSTMIIAAVRTDSSEMSAAGTTFGQEFLRLIRLGPYPLDAYLDGLLLIYRHRDVPGLIGFIGTILGKHRVNIAHMALGRTVNEPGGDSVAVLNLDNAPSKEALLEIAAHPEVSGVEVVRLPPAGAALPWLVQQSNTADT
jgi:D-3-phosphoglycerate dehydrogenase